MTSKTAVKRAKAIARLPLDIPMAALAAASVAFVAYAMPGDLLAGAVGATGLPAVVPAAQPPLGGTARAALVAIGGAGTFLMVWLVLRALGKRPRPAAPASDLPDFDIAPRLRRADAHPDAPSRRPIFAGLDLGEPDEADEPALEELELVERFEPEDEDHAWETAAAETAAEPETDADLDADDEVEPMFRIAAAPAEEPEFEPEPEQEQEPWSEPEPWPIAEPAAAEPARIRIEPVAQSAPADEEETTISSLMQRLERGLERRVPAGARSAPAPVQAAPAATDARLSSALGDLRRLAGRGVSDPRPSAPRS